LESKLVFITPESIAFKHYSEAQEQTRNLKLFNTEVAVSIGQHIEEALATTLPNQLAQALAPLTQTLHELASKLTSTNQRAIGDFANEFAHRLEANTGEHLQSLATTLGNLSVSLQDLESRLNNSGSGLAQNVKESSETMGNFIGSMETAARSIRDAAMPLTENSRLVGEASQRLVDATHNIEQIVGNTQNAVQEICDVLRTTLETTAGQWKDYEERFQEVDESLASVLDQITSTVQRTTESLGDFVKKIDEKFSGAIDKLGGGIEELNEFAQSIEQVTHRFDGQDRHQVSPK
jgi:methyl-accepting chemotaxis protein